MNDPRLLYVFRDGWQRRVAEVARGDAPAESYGFFALARRGVDVDSTDSGDATSLPWLVAARAYQRLYAIPRSGLGYRLDQARAVRRRLGGDRGRIVVATTDSIALPLLALKRRGALSNPIVHTSIGLSDGVARGAVQRRLAQRYARFAECAHAVLVYTPAERDAFREFAPAARVHVVRLPIDAEWWAGDAGGDVEVDVLAPGRDVSRSFRTLAAAVAGASFRTQIVGRLARAQGVDATPTLEVADDVSFAELRRRLHRARIVAIPSRRSTYGSGQATALQAMAAGRPVVMTDTGWARHFGLEPGTHFVDVPPEDPDALRDAIDATLEDEVHAAAVARAAQRAVADTFSVERQADELLALVG